jgi:hypothetical protein
MRTFQNIDAQMSPLPGRTIACANEAVKQLDATK